MDDPAFCTIEVTCGFIKGTVTLLPDGKQCYSFRGVPYAVPPTGDLRFRPPQPLHRYSERPLDCTVERSVSLASSYLPPDSVGSEDCLFLNVYSPVNPSKEANDRIPVMVWLHGGAFCTGSGDSSIYHPEWLVREGVIVVTVNYRLGPAGFLCLPSVGIFGNMGLKDQRLALRWVHTNIHAFGGDATNVTLFGESAGGVSAHLHCLSRGSRPLFHKVILQSGAATSPIVFQKGPRGNTRRLAEYFGCPAEAPDSQVLDTLMNIAPELLAKHQQEALTAYERTLDHVYPFRPTVEEASAIDPIITEDVFELLKQPNAPSIPMIVGVTDGEALYKINTFRQHIDRYKREPQRFVPDTLHVPAQERDAIARQIITFYCGSEEPSLRHELQLSQIFTDILYLMPAVQAAELQLQYQTGDVYFYTFSCETELNKFRQLWKVPSEYRGAGHADDVCYLFSSKFLRTDTIDVRSNAGRLRERMCSLWANFAKTGKPSSVWKPLVRDSDPALFCLKALNIGNRELVMKERYLDERVQFWRQLVSKYNHTY
ncbi:acetylcholinesterase-like [Anopheles bellator]|uniref:acetylcholinesterase-like n=1 Tax=Anopheles bellator TaxID=139047 RepID=UPI0026474EFE|nr:acetylcholinesterase-like [Anopheles bellator]XP_058054646.1 acetylcholinesterase-like [Anopheles bellator]